MKHIAGLKKVNNERSIADTIQNTLLEKIVEVNNLPCDNFRRVNMVSSLSFALSKVNKDTPFQSFQEYGHVTKGTPMKCFITILDEFEQFSALSSFDKSVLNAACSIILSGYPVFSSRHLYFLITGRDALAYSVSLESLETKKIRETENQVLYAITQSMRNLSNRNILLSTESFPDDSVNDASKILSIVGNNKKDQSNNGMIFKLLSFDEYFAVINNVSYSTYVFQTRPKILENAIKRDRICVIPEDAYRLPMSSTWQMIVIRDYLISRITSLANEKNKQFQTSISIQSIYDTVDNNYYLSFQNRRENPTVMGLSRNELGFFDKLKNKNTRIVTQGRLRKKAYDILRTWIEIRVCWGKSSYLTDVKIRKKGNCIHSFDLVFDPDTEEMIRGKMQKTKS